jgi:hypothetical protein
MDIKRQIAHYAREFYKKPITPFDFVIGQISKKDFNIRQLFDDETSNPNMLNIDYDNFFVFAY